MSYDIFSVLDVLGVTKGVVFCNPLLFFNKFLVLIKTLEDRKNLQQQIRNFKKKEKESVNANWYGKI